LPSVMAGKRWRRSSTRTLWHTARRPLSATTRNPQPDVVVLGTACGIDEQIGEGAVRCDGERLGEAVPDDLVVHEGAVRRPVDVGQQSPVVVARDNVAFEPNAASDREQCAGVARGLVAVALGVVGRSIAEGGVSDFGGVDADQPHALLAVADGDVDRVAIDDLANDRVRRQDARNRCRGRARRGRCTACADTREDNEDRDDAPHTARSTGTL
jgi:hypothetical protein